MNHNIPSHKKCRKKVEVDRTVPGKTIREYHPSGPGLELTRKEKSWATEEGLKMLSQRRNEDSRDNIGCSQEDSTQFSVLVSCC